MCVSGARGSYSGERYPTKPFYALAIVAVALVLVAGCAWDYVSPEGVVHEDPHLVTSWSCEEGFEFDFESDVRYPYPR